MDYNNLDKDKLISKSDYNWYLELFNERQRTKLSSQFIDEVIRKSMDCAEKVFENLLKKHKNINIKELINSYSTNLIINTQDKSYRLIASYEKSNNELTVYKNSIIYLSNTLEDKGDDSLITKDKLMDVVLSHELYHIIEMNEEDIFTYSEIFETSILGLKRKKKFPLASEIGAYHFSKLVNGLDFSPLMLEEIYKRT